MIISYFLKCLINKINIFYNFIIKMLENFIDNLFEHCKNEPRKCPFSLDNLDIPQNLKDIINAFDLDIPLKKLKKGESSQQKHNKPMRPPPDYASCCFPSNSFLPTNNLESVIGAGLVSPVISSAYNNNISPNNVSNISCISYLISFLFYLLIIFLLIYLFISLIQNLSNTDEKNSKKSLCPFADNFTFNPMSDEELMEDICRIISESNKDNLKKCQKVKNITKKEFISQSNIKYDALCFVKNLDQSFCNNLKFIKKNYNISIYFVLIKDSNTSDETLNKINSLIQENNNYKLDIITETPNQDDKIYNLKYLDYIKEASFVINFENLEKDMLDSIIKLCIVSETPFILKNDNLSSRYNKFIELKWGQFYNLENYQEKINDFMKNYNDFFKS